MKTYGKKVWLFADAFYDSKYNTQVSHESVCVLNTSDKEATITMTLFFEDRGCLQGFAAKCGAMRTHHIRMDKLVSIDGLRVPSDVPYAILVESDVEVVAQYTRLETPQAEFALMTTMGFAGE